VIHEVQARGLREGGEDEGDVEILEIELDASIDRLDLLSVEDARRPGPQKEDGEKDGGGARPRDGGA
jgi:hypothetical protein